MVIQLAQNMYFEVLSGHELGTSLLGIQIGCFTLLHSKYRKRQISVVTLLLPIYYRSSQARLASSQGTVPNKKNAKIRKICKTGPESGGHVVGTGPSRQEGSRGVWACVCKLSGEVIGM